MGCDGGTIPRRDELVKTKKKAGKKDRSAELASKWRCCAISQQLLAMPVVMCGLGFLYTKLTVLEGLLNKNLPESAAHIKSMKDIKELRLTANPEYKPGEEQKQGNSDDTTASYICPITGLEMSGKFSFIAFWTCGCVMSERAFKEIKNKSCIQCQTAFTENDIVVLNPSEDEKKINEKHMNNRQVLLKANKKKVVAQRVGFFPTQSDVKKGNWPVYVTLNEDILPVGDYQIVQVPRNAERPEERVDLGPGPSNSEAPKLLPQLPKLTPRPSYYSSEPDIVTVDDIETKDDENTVVALGNRREIPVNYFVNHCYNKRATSTIAKPPSAPSEPTTKPAQQTGRKNSVFGTTNTTTKTAVPALVMISKRKNIQQLDEAKIDASFEKALKNLKRPTTSTTAAGPSGIKKGRPSTSVASDPHKSDVYKSLFTSHASEQQQKRAHWVTYNPFYN